MYRRSLRMRFERSARIVLILFIFAASTFMSANEGEKVRTFLLNQKHLKLTKRLWKEGHSRICSSMKYLIRKADQALKRGPYSVTYKKQIPPSGDKKDFLSYGAYFWPNPDTKNGVPWISIDGYINPSSAVDWNQIKSMARDVEVLTLAFFFTGNELYAKHAVRLLRTWFIDKKSRMNPNANYSKLIPGRNRGGYSVAGFGYRFRRIYDSAGILESSALWTEADREALILWTRDFIWWVENDLYGDNEKLSCSNHATFYTMIMALQTMYIGDDRKARNVILNYINKEFPKQFAPDGSQPFEMKRANNYDYHLVNLMIALDIAQLADHFDDINLWNHKTSKGAGLRKSIEFLIQYLSDLKKWPFFKEDTFKIGAVKRYCFLRRASLGFREPIFEFAGNVICGKKKRHLVELTYPRAAVPLGVFDIFRLILQPFVNSCVSVEKTGDFFHD